MVTGFFACPIRGDRKRLPIYRQIVLIMEEEGITLVSKHQTQDKIISSENKLSPVDIYRRDWGWLRMADVFVAEITKPSGGVGAEVADAAHMGKPILGLYEKAYENGVSAYLRGKIEFAGTLFPYSNVAEIRPAVRDLVKAMRK